MFLFAFKWSSTMTPDRGPQITRAPPAGSPVSSFLGEATIMSTAPSAFSSPLSASWCRNSRRKVRVDIRCRRSPEA